LSYSSINTATDDVALQARVEAAIQKEALSGSVADSDFAASALADPVWAMGRMMYPVAIDTEAAYESALAAGNPDPGGDPSVVTDGAILSAVQAHWPEDTPGGGTP